MMQNSDAIDKGGSGPEDSCMGPCTGPQWHIHNP